MSMAMKRPAIPEVPSSFYHKILAVEITSDYNLMDDSKLPKVELNKSDN